MGDHQQHEKDPEGAGDKTDEYESPFKTSTFNAFDACFVLVSMGLLVADLVTDTIVTCKYFTSGDTTWAALTLSFILFPSIILQVFSVRWYLVDDDMTRLKWLTHVFQMGPLHRYVNLFRTGMEARRTKDPLDFERLFYQQSDVCMLRLFESFLESAPQVVLQLYIMVATNDENFWTGTSAAVSLFSLCWAMGAYSRAHRKVRRDKKIVSWPGLVLQTIWRIGMISSRVVALVLFASVFKAYIFVATGIHFIGMLVWVMLQKTDFCTNPVEERVFNCVVAVIYVFCFFNLKEGQSRKRVLVFYSIMLAENTVLVLVWYNHRTIEEWYNAVGFTIVFGGFAIGAVSMIMYYRYLHPRNNFTLCGPKPKKDTPRSLDSTPAVSPSTSPDAVFSPELFRHGHSPSSKQPRRSDVNHNDAIESPLARPLSRPLSQTSLNAQQDGKVVVDQASTQGGNQVIGRGNVAGPGKKESCVYFRQNETGTAVAPADVSVVTNSSLIGSFRGNVSGFGTELVDRFDSRRTRILAGNDSVLSGTSGIHDSARPHGGAIDESRTSYSREVPHQDQNSSFKPETAFSPDLPQMPEIVDSPNKIMSSYEAQQIYDSILGIERPRRSSKRKLKFEERPNTGFGLKVGVLRSRKSGEGGKVAENGNQTKKISEITNVRKAGNSETEIAVPKSDITTRKSHETAELQEKNTAFKKSGSAAKIPFDHSTGRNIQIEATVECHLTDNVVKKDHVTSHMGADINTAHSTAYRGDKAQILKCSESENTASMSRMCKDRVGPLVSYEREVPKPKVNNEIIDSSHSHNQPSFPSPDKQADPRIDYRGESGIGSPMLRAALARDLSKAKQRVLQDSINHPSWQSLNKAEMPSTGRGNALQGGESGTTESVVVRVNNDKSKATIDQGEVLSSNGGVCVVKISANDNDSENKLEKSIKPDFTREVKIEGVRKSDDVHERLNSEGKEDLVCADVRDQEQNLKVGPHGDAKGKTHTSPFVQKYSRFSPTKGSRVLGSLSPNSSIFSRSPMKSEGSNDPLLHPQANGSSECTQISSPKSCSKANIKRVRSLKGSVPSGLRSPSSAPAAVSSPQTSKVKSPSGKDQKLTQTVTGSPKIDFKGKIKRVLSLRGPASSENVSHCRSPAAHCYSQEDVQTSAENSPNPVPRDAHSRGAPKSVLDQVATSPRKILFEKQQNNSAPERIALPVAGDQFSMPEGMRIDSRDKENMGSLPFSKIDDSKLPSPKKGARLYAKDKENMGVTLGSVTGVATKLKIKTGSPAEKKPPRRSLNRIPTNLVAENVALFNSPKKGEA